MDKKRIALITTWFPPNNGVAVNRMKAFATYLKGEFNLEIFTVGDVRESRNVNGVIVHTFPISKFWNKAKHHSKDRKVVHHFKSLLNILAIKFKISKFKSWEDHVNVAIGQIQTQNPFDLVISSFAPIEPHNVAYSLKLKYPNLKWIADMRDEMSENPFGSDSENKFLRKKEQEFGPFIDAITTVSEPILNGFKHLFPDVKYFEEVRNGFDHSVKPSRSFNDVFTFVYAGTFYGKNKPELFLKVLNQLKDNNRICNNFKVEFIGTSKNFNYPKELEENINFLQKVTYLEAVHKMKDADCNLLFSVPVPSKGRYTGKLFDYLSVEKPIIALVDKNDVGADLINENNAGFVCDFYNEQEIGNAILGAYDLWKKKEFLPINSNKTELLHRKYQVKNFAKLISKVIEE